MNRRTRFLFLLVCCVLVSIPFLIVKFPPITDLPQHVSQVRIFQEAVNDSNSLYKVQWLTPYSLVYSLLAGCWALVGPEDAGRVGMLIIGWLWVFLIHYFAFKKRRPIIGAVFVSALFFCHIIYWGFYQFALGWVLFMGWVLLIRSQKRKKGIELMILSIYALALYMTHVLWLLVAIVWLLFGDFVFRRDFKKMAVRMGSVIPVAVLVFFWYPSLASYGFTSQTLWVTSPFERLSPVWIVDATFGGLRGSAEYVLFGVLLTWVVAVLWQSRKELKASVNKELLLLFAGFFFLGLVLPDKHVNTIRFCQRWVPPAFSFLLLSMPPLKIKRKMFEWGVVTILAGFIASTAISWKSFEFFELSGLKATLHALPEAPMVLGLSYAYESKFIRGSPFIQVFAYSQMYKGGELNLSFADFGPSLVVYKEIRRKQWTRELEWNPEQVKREDFKYFDYVIINASMNLHYKFRKEPYLQPVTNHGRWRLYKVLSKYKENL